MGVREVNNRGEGLYRVEMEMIDGWETCENAGFWLCKPTRFRFLLKYLNYFFGVDKDICTIRVSRMHPSWADYGGGTFRYIGRGRYRRVKKKQ